MAQSTRLVALRDSIITRLEELITNPRVTYSVTTKNGSEQFGWTEYQAMLFKQLQDVNTLINAVNPYIVGTKVVV